MNVSDYGKKMYGVAEGISYGQNERVDELNDRISARVKPDYPLPPNFNSRPVMTRYSVFPMLNNRISANVPIESNYNYALETNFTPPLMMSGPPAGFINNINTESQLRNQFFALQKGAGQDVYIPSKDSDLYKVTIVSTPQEQPYPLLFEKSNFDQSLHPNVMDQPNVGQDFFHNNTRTQLRGIPL